MGFSHSSNLIAYNLNSNDHQAFIIRIHTNNTYTISPPIPQYASIVKDMDDDIDFNSDDTKVIRCGVEGF